jgi:hypothetical protein
MDTNIYGKRGKSAEILSSPGCMKDVYTLTSATRPDDELLVWLGANDPSFNFAKRCRNSLFVKKYSKKATFANVIEAKEVIVL